MGLKNVKNEVFFIDGSLRDVVIEDVDQMNWKQFISYASKSATNIVLTIDSVEKIVDDYSVEELFKLSKQNVVLLKIVVLDIYLHCHFFDESKIEIDIDPREIKRDEQIYKIEQFFEKLAIELNKEISFYGENCRVKKLYSIKPS